MESPQKYGWMLFCGSLIVYLLTIGGHLYSPDEEVMFRTIRSIAERRTLAIEPMPAGFGSRRGPDGSQYSQYGLGQPILALPFYALGKLLQKTLPPAQEFWREANITFAEAYHGKAQGAAGSYWVRFGVSLFNPFVCAALAAVLFLFCFELTKNSQASLLTAILFAFGTMAWVHSKPFFSEALAGLCLLLAFYFIARGRNAAEASWGVWLGAGFFAAYAVFVRMDSILAFPGLGVYYLLANRRSLDPERAYQDLMNVAQSPDKGKLLPLHPDFFRRTLLAASPLVLMFVLLLWINYACFGHPFATGYSDQPEGLKFSTPVLAGLYGFLFSIGKGFFFFSPPLVLFFLAIRHFYAEYRSATIALLVTIVCVLCVHAKWQNWGGGWCWGPRHIFILTIFMAVPIVALLKNWQHMWIRVAYYVLLIVGIAVQVYGCSQSFIDYYWYAFRQLDQEPTTRLLYSPVEDLAYLGQYFVLMEYRDADDPASPRDVIVRQSGSQRSKRMAFSSPAVLPPPLSYSFYIWEHSVWSGYIRLWREQGKHDFFWLWVGEIIIRSDSASAAKAG